LLSRLGDLHRLSSLAARLCVPALLITVPAPPPSPSPYHPTQLESFGDSLFDEKDYCRASGEYQRALFLRSTPDDTLRYKVGVALRLGGQSAASAAWLTRDGFAHKRTPLGHASLYQLSYAWFEHGCPDCLASALAADGLGAAEAWATDVSYLLAMSTFLLHDWEEASLLFSKAEGDAANRRLSSAAGDLSAVSHDASQHGWKTPGAAAALSTVVPGLGKVYTGRYVDGVASFVSVGLTGYLAHEQFERNGEDSVLGWFYLGTAVVLYLGNIFGSYQSAHVVNREAAQLYQTEGLRIFLSSHPEGLGLRGEFSFTPGGRQP